MIFPVLIIMYFGSHITLYVAVIETGPIAGVNYTNLLAQSANVLAVILFPHSVSPTKLRPTLPETHLEIVPNFYALLSTPYSKRSSIHLLAQKLLVK